MALVGDLWRKHKQNQAERAYLRQHYADGSANLSFGQRMKGGALAAINQSIWGNMGTIGQIVQRRGMGERNVVGHLALERVATAGFVGGAIAGHLGAKYNINKKPGDKVNKTDIKADDDPIDAIKRVDEKFTESVNAVRVSVDEMITKTTRQFAQQDQRLIAVERNVQQIVFLHRQIPAQINRLEFRVSRVENIVYGQNSLHGMHSGDITSLQKQIDELKKSKGGLDIGGLIKAGIASFVKAHPFLTTAGAYAAIKPFLPAAGTIATATAGLAVTAIAAGMERDKVEDLQSEWKAYEDETDPIKKQKRKEALDKKHNPMLWKYVNFLIKKQKPNVNLTARPSTLTPSAARAREKGGTRQESEVKGVSQRVGNENTVDISGTEIMINAMTDISIEAKAQLTMKSKTISLQADKIIIDADEVEWKVKKTTTGKTSMRGAQSNLGGPTNRLGGSGGGGGGYGGLRRPQDDNEELYKPPGITGGGGPAPPGGSGYPTGPGGYPSGTSPSPSSGGPTAPSTTVSPSGKLLGRIPPTLSDGVNPLGPGTGNVWRPTITGGSAGQPPDGMDAQTMSPGANPLSPGAGNVWRPSGGTSYQPAGPSDSSSGSYFKGQQQPSVGQPVGIPGGTAAPPQPGGGGAVYQQSRLTAGSNGRVDPKEFYAAAVGEVSKSSLNGYVPKDGAKWGITTGSPQEWARMLVGVAQQESGFNAHAGGGGLMQFAQADLQRYGVNTPVHDPHGQLQASINQMSKFIVGTEKSPGAGVISGAGRGPGSDGGRQGASAYFGSMIGDPTVPGSRAYREAGKYLRADKTGTAWADKQIAGVDVPRIAGQQQGPTSQGPAAQGQQQGPAATRVQGGSTQGGIAGVNDISGNVTGLAHGKMSSVTGLIVHHTSDHHSLEQGIKDGQNSGYTAQYRMDRDGSISRIVPEGQLAQHIKNGTGAGAGRGNHNMEGIEIVANSDKDITPAQHEAMKQFIGDHSRKYGYDPTKNVFGHSEVNPGHRENEGEIFSKAIRGGDIVAGAARTTDQVAGPGVPAATNSPAATKVDQGAQAPAPQQVAPNTQTPGAQQVTAPNNAQLGQERMKVTGNISGVDPRLVDIVKESSKYLPEGYTAKLESGMRSSGSGRHPMGKAVDIGIYDDKGKKLGWYQNPETFREYEKFAQTAKKIQSEKYPELNKDFSWGGYFQGKLGQTYGASDLMHLDLGGAKNMQAGNWETGLNKNYKGYFDTADKPSIGMGDVSKYALATTPNAQNPQVAGPGAPSMPLPSRWQQSGKGDSGQQSPQQQQQDRTGWASLGKSFGESQSQKQSFPGTYPTGVPGIVTDTDPNRMGRTAAFGRSFGESNNPFQTMRDNASRLSDEQIARGAPPMSDPLFRDPTFYAGQNAASLEPKSDINNMNPKDERSPDAQGDAGPQDKSAPKDDSQVINPPSHDPEKQKPDASAAPSRNDNDGGFDPYAQM